MLNLMLSNEKGTIQFLLILPLLLLLAVSASSAIKTTTEYPSQESIKAVLGEEEDLLKEENKIKEELRKEEEKLKEQLVKETGSLVKEEKKAILEKVKEIKKKEEEKKKELKKLADQKLREVRKIAEEEKKRFASKAGETKDWEAANFNSDELKKILELDSIEEQVDHFKALRQRTATESADNPDHKDARKFEFRDRGLKIKYEFKDGERKVRVESEGGEEMELGEDDLEEVENEIKIKLDEKGIKIATGSGKPVLFKNNIAALTNFPLSIDLESNQLVVTTPKGQKIVTVLPDQAVKNLIEAGVISNVDNNGLNTELVKEVGLLDSEIDLEERGDELVYKVKGKKKYKLFGFIPVNTSNTAYISAQSGKAVAKDQSLLTKIIDVFSP